MLHVVRNRLARADEELLTNGYNTTRLRAVAFRTVASAIPVSKVTNRPATQKLLATDSPSASLQLAPKIRRPSTNSVA